MKVIIGIATTGTRQKSLEMTLESLRPQSDHIFLYDNSVNPDKADNGKFWGLTQISEPCYYFSCDDDIIYPEDYVRQSILAIERHNCIVSYHGRILRGLNRPYYRGHTSFACLHTHPQTIEIDVAGTGVTGFRTDYFNPVGIHKAIDQRMSDLVFSLEAAKQGKKIMHIGHKGGWINYIEQPKGTTIYEMEVGKETRQTEIANEIFLLKK